MTIGAIIDLKYWEGALNTVILINCWRHSEPPSCVIKFRDPRPCTGMTMNVLTGKGRKRKEENRKYGVLEFRHGDAIRWPTGQWSRELIDDNRLR